LILVAPVGGLILYTKALHTNDDEPDADTDAEKARALLAAFFPPLPPMQLESSQQRPVAGTKIPSALIMSPLTDQYIETAVMNMNSVQRWGK
jgi:hypothetical protein